MTYISDELRRLVKERANHCCEYCLMPEDDGYLMHEIDHILPEKHRGQTTADNLCLSCMECNRYKGSDIGSFDVENQAFAILYNPRTMKWAEHFRLNKTYIEPLTAEGRVTEFLLRLNSESRMTRRSVLLGLGRYPC